MQYTKSYLGDVKKMAYKESGVEILKGYLKKNQRDGDYHETNINSAFTPDKFWARAWSDETDTSPTPVIELAQITQIISESVNAPGLENLWFDESFAIFIHL